MHRIAYEIANDTNLARSTRRTLGRMRKYVDQLRKYPTRQYASPGIHAVGWE